jgi:hypothetical protein
VGSYSPMNPLLLGGAALVALFALSSSSSTSTSNMVFRDYQWVTLLPTGYNTTTYVPGAGPGGPKTNVPLGPPPGLSSSQGAWHVYSGGMAIDGDGTQWTAFPNVPAGYDLYVWFPITPGGSFSADPNTPPQPVQINGYWIIPSQWRRGTTSEGVEGIWGPNNMPVPPGESSSAGAWHMVSPGYNVWLTPTNSNAYESAALAWAATLPIGQAGLQAQGQPYEASVPPPSAVPIAVTPPTSDKVGPAGNPYGY